MSTQWKRPISTIFVSVLALLSIFSVVTTPWTIDASGHPSHSFQRAGEDFTSTDRLGPSVFKVVSGYAPVADTEQFVKYLVQDGDETRLTDLPLSDFIPCNIDQLCDLQGRVLYWIIPVAIPVSLPSKSFVFIAGLAVTDGGTPEDPLLVLDEVDLLGPAHVTPDCDLSKEGANKPQRFHKVEIGWADIDCVGPPVLVSTLTQWITHGCLELEAWQPCNSGGNQGPTTTTPAKQSVPNPVAGPLPAPVTIDAETYQVSWDAPANNNSPITNYVVYAFTCNGDYTGQHVYTGSDQTVTDFKPATEARGQTLNPGVSYKFTVRSQNGLGWDATTFESAAATSCTEVFDPFAVDVEPLNLGLGPD